MLYHCRMWCYAIGVEAVVLRSLVCNLVHCLSVSIQLVRYVLWNAPCLDAGFPARLGPSGKFVENATQLHLP